MIELKEVDFDGKKRIEIYDRVYSIKENPVGVREKFWIVRRGGNLIQESPIVTDMLFKYNRNDTSSEDAGEVVASKIMQMCGLKTVDYHFATLTKENGEKVKGVLCGSFKKRLSEIETSAFALQTVLTPLSFDEQTGKADKPINTVYGLIDDLTSILGDSKETKELIGEIKNELLQQALMDFILAQTDRHWLNTSFLEVMRADKYFIKKAACYDNGCIAFLKRKKRAIETINGEIKGDFLNSKRMIELMDGYMPMFAVKTPTVLIDVDRYNKVGTAEKLKVNPDKELKKVFINEMTDEILNNGDMALFYRNMVDVFGYDRKTRQIDLKKVYNRIEAGGDKIDEPIKTMITGVMTYQLNEIQTELDRKLDFYRRHREDNEEYSC